MANRRHKHHKIAAWIIVAAAICCTISAVIFSNVEHVSFGLSMYWAITTATTAGYGDVTPHTVAGHWVAAFMMLTVVPLLACSFSLFTSGLMSIHFDRIKDHIEDRFNEWREGS